VPKKTSGYFVRLTEPDWLEKQKHAGNVVASVLKECAEAIKNKQPNLTTKELEAMAEDHIASSSGCSPTFKGYRGFPSVICASVNDVLVHGIPNDDELQEGDVVSIDLGVTYDGAIADAAFSCIYGQPKEEGHREMLIACQLALNEAIKSILPGSRIGVIGETIQAVASRKFGVVDNYGGHGITWNCLHDDPFISNKATKYDGLHIQPGLSIAIEPMFVFGMDNSTKVSEDNWAVKTKQIGCHFEHSVTVDNNGIPQIITEHLMDVKDYIREIPNEN
jgi:methionyl aminopeptidase